MFEFNFSFLWQIQFNQAIGEMMGKTVYWHENEKRIELKQTTVTDADVIVDSSDTSAQAATPTPTATPVPQPAAPVSDTKKQAPDTSGFISKEAAKKIALQKAGIAADSTVFESIELDFDDGVWKYEIEFRNGQTEYDADIKAADGTILKWEKDID